MNPESNINAFRAWHAAVCVCNDFISKKMIDDYLVSVRWNKKRTNRNKRKSAHTSQWWWWCENTNINTYHLFSAQWIASFGGKLHALSLSLSHTLIPKKNFSFTIKSSSCVIFGTNLLFLFGLVAKFTHDNFVRCAWCDGPTYIFCVRIDCDVRNNRSKHKISKMKT